MDSPNEPLRRLEQDGSRHGKRNFRYCKRGKFNCLSCHCWPSRCSLCPVHGSVRRWVLECWAVVPRIYYEEFALVCYLPCLPYSEVSHKVWYILGKLSAGKGVQSPCWSWLPPIPQVKLELPAWAAVINKTSWKSLFLFLWFLISIDMYSLHTSPSVRLMASTTWLALLVKERHV